MGAVRHMLPERELLAQCSVLKCLMLREICGRGENYPFHTYPYQTAPNCTFFTPNTQTRTKFGSRGVGMTKTPKRVHKKAF
jgi:hypothetical protein